MKLGELLIGAGVVDPAELERGLAVQRVTRVRLGSTLVEMGAVTADEVARGLARQHGVPAALERHLHGRDPALVPRLPAAVARAHWALPVALSRGGDGLNLVVCLRDPSPDTIASVRAAAGMPVIPSVASETSLRRELELAYPDDGVVEVEPEPEPDDGSFDIDFYEPSQPFANLGEASLVGLDDQYVSKDHSQNTGGTGGVPVVRTPLSPPPVVPAAGSAPPQPRIAPPPPPMRLDEVKAALAGASTADRITEVAVDYLRGGWKAALIMAVKEKMALGQRGFGGGITDASVESIVVPLDQPSVLRTAHDDRRPFLGEAPIGSLAQDRFMRLFSELHTRTIAVSPVLVRDRAACLIFALGPTARLGEAGATVAALAHAMGEAYLRIIMASKHRG